MPDLTIPELDDFFNPSPDPLAYQVVALQRLVLELTKHISPLSPLPPGAVAVIEDLKRRHPDV